MANHNTLITIPTSITSSTGDVWAFAPWQTLSGTYDGTSKLVYQLDSNRTIWFEGDQSAYWGDDNPGANPTNVSYDTSTGTVSFVPSTLGSFVSPFYTAASTSSEGFSYSGTLTVNGTTLEYAIPSTASSGTYMLMSSASSTPQLSIVHGTGSSTGSAPNFDQTKIWTLLSPTEDELARIDLTKKKVFCNFW